MGSGVRRVKRERVTGGKTQLDGGSNDVPNCFSAAGVAGGGRL